jgi:SAM-dependent methyltransferase
MWRKRRTECSQSRNVKISDVCLNNSLSYSLMENTKRYRPHYRFPIHVEPYHIPKLFIESIDHCFWITPKADGVPMMLEVTTDSNVVVVFHVECIERRLYIIDLIRLSIQDVTKLTFEQRLNMISTITRMPVLITMEVDGSLIDELHNVTDVIKPIMIGSYSLYVKPVFRIEIAGVDAKVCGDLLNTLFEEYDTTANINTYPNDGWIVYPRNSITPLKFKPDPHLTLDVRYNHDEDRGGGRWDLIANDLDTSYPLRNIRIGRSNLKDTELINGQIYRCIWSNNNANNANDNNYCWIPIEIRSDKALPNDINRYGHIMSRIRCQHVLGNDWDSNTFIQHVIDAKDSYYYKGRNDKNHERSLIQELQSIRVSELIKNVIEYFDDNEKMRILDIGSGTCNLHSKLREICKGTPHRNITDIEYYGLETDPLTLCKKYEAPSTVIRLWGSMNLPEFEYYTDLLSISENNFQFITFMNSIHYVEDLEATFESIINMTTQKAYIVIFSMFSDLIDASYDAEYEERSIRITQLSKDKLESNKSFKSLYRFEYPWKEESFEEEIYSTHHIEDAISNINSKNMNKMIQIDHEKTNLMNSDIISANRLNDIGHHISLETNEFLNIHRCFIISIE